MTTKDSQVATVREAMTTNTRTVSPLDTLASVQHIFDRNSFHHLPVVDDGTLVGVISTSDLERSKHGASLFRNKNAERYNEALLQTIVVEAVMTQGFHSISPDATTREAYLKFKEGDIRCLLVLEDDSLIGIITPLDLCEIYLA